ncbi:MAG: LL-diaminopimelate aminotransferase [Planctomycetota bacterium]
MPLVNENFLNLQAGYLFPEIARRVRDHQAANPDAKLIKLGIGDVTEPLAPAVAEAMKKAVDEMTTHEGFRGYGPGEGYEFLRHAIAENDFRTRGCDVADDEVFISDGSKCDAANFLDVLGPGNAIAVTDPVYPVYVDTNVMSGNATKAGNDGRYGGLVYLEAGEANGFAPDLPNERVDVIYLCFPNNPTGAVASRETLAKWVAYAREHGSVILFDAAYEGFIRDPAIPHSIYEIDGARECAVEFRSFSKTAGFTGTRCAFTVVPKSLQGRTKAGESIAMHGLWSRRQNTKFNGVGYVVQRGAEAAYSEAGKQQIAGLVDGYMVNADLIKTGLESAGLTVFGGDNAPYAWVKCPAGVTSWQMFDKLLQEAGVVCTPGSGFGQCGEGFFRLSAFNSRANVEEAVQCVRKVL